MSVTFLRTIFLIRFTMRTLFLPRKQTTQRRSVTRRCRLKATQTPRPASSFRRKLPRHLPTKRSSTSTSFDVKRLSMSTSFDAKRSSTSTKFDVGKSIVRNFRSRRRKPFRCRSPTCTSFSGKSRPSLCRRSTPVSSWSTLAPRPYLGTVRRHEKERRGKV